VVQAVEEIKTSGYRIKLESFEGPLDLLLFLIKRDEIDIYDIPIARVTEQYLKHIQMMEVLDLDVAGEFLLMAATLVRIKSRMLLPRQLEEDEEDEGDPREELVQRLLEYRRFKRVAEGLTVRAGDRARRLGRPLPDLDDMPEEEPELLIPVDLAGLLRTFSGLLERTPRIDTYEVILDEFTLEEKVEHIMNRLVGDERVEFNNLFRKTASRIEVVMTFVAILELLRMQKIALSQSGIFGRIWIRRREDEDGNGAGHGEDTGGEFGAAGRDGIGDDDRGTGEGDGGSESDGNPGNEGGLS